MGTKDQSAGVRGGLGEYRTKRNPENTPEPFGERASFIPPGVFVVQKHAARRLHYDLRLELDGRLQSWAIPKGPSFDPEVKRLAVKVEDHPLDYVDFEGVIPEGYGAGSMIVWDRGLWRPLEDPEEGLRNGKLLFRLEGYKLRGVWTLFSTGGKGTGAGDVAEWLLVKKPDAFAKPGGRAVPETSVLSGLSVEELSRAAERAVDLEARLAEAGVPAGDVDLAALSPMLAEVAEEPFDDPDWLFELKYDGFRLLADKSGSKPRLRYRSGRDATRAFPEITAALAALPYRRLVLDGEVVVLDPEGRPVFNRLQKRVQLERDRDLMLARWLHPATFMVFDLLVAEGRDLRDRPLHERKDLLERILPEAGPLRFADHFEGNGRALFEAVRAQGLEGVMAKRRTSPYREARSRDWLKIRSERTEAFAVIGYTAPKGSRTGFGGLHLARPDATGGWCYVGRVGSGFTEDLLESLTDRFAGLETDAPPCDVPKPDKSSVWLRPDVVVEVTYLTQTEEGIIRQSRFRALRDEPASLLMEGAELPALEDPGDSPKGRVSFTNLDKVFFPEHGITKGELIEYHREVAPWMLRYLKDRPIALARYPDGIHGKSFFQKHAPAFTPSWVRTARIFSEQSEKEREQFVVDDLETLEFLINLGCIPIHAWTARVSSLEHPDWAVLDLDPKEAPFSSVVRLALAAKSLADALELPAFVKTSGSSGMHVLLTMGARYTHDQARSVAHLLARILVDRHPDIATIDRSLERRGGRVYIDFVQNGRGRLLAAPYTVRERPGAPVSTPLDWAELHEGLDPTSFNIRTVPRRLAALGRCPLEGVLGEGPDLEALLARVAHVVGGG